MMSGDEKISFDHSKGVVASNPTGAQALPLELLREIFLMGARTRDFQSNLKFALLVSWVCRWWRDIALDTPALWSCILVKLQTWWSSSHSAKVSECLRRSNEVPLHLKVTLQGILDGDLERYRMSKLMELLVPHISRWRALDIASDNSVTFNLAFSFMHGQASTLKSLTLRCTLVNACWTINPRFPSDFSSPALASLFLHSINFPDSWGEPLTRQFNQLEAFSIHSFSNPHSLAMRSFVMTLSQLPNLSHLTMIAILPGLDNSFTVQYLPRMTSVSFRSMEPVDLYNFFLRVAAPDLTTITIADVTGVMGYGKTIGAILEKIFQQIDLPGRFPKLDHLILDVTGMSREVVLAVLSVPFVQRLTLHSHHIDSDSSELKDVLLSMTQPISTDGGKWLCPRMQILEICARRHHSEGVQLVMDSRLQASRGNSPLAPTPSTIQSVRLIFEQCAIWRGEEDEHRLTSYVPHRISEL